MFFGPFGIGSTVPPQEIMRAFESAMAAAAAGGGSCGAGMRASAGNACAAAAAAPSKPAARTCAGEQMSKGTVVKKAAPTPRENVRPAPAVKSSSSAPSASAPGHAAVASAPGHAAVAFTESADAITLALDLPGREKKDVDIAIIDGGRFLELKTPAVPAAGGRRARPAVHARVALPETDRLDFAATAARMAAGELVVRIPKLPPPPPPQTWRVPVMSSEEDGEGERRAEPATTTPPKPDAAVPASAPASDDDEDGSWVEASSDDDEDKDGGKAARRKSKKGAPVSGAVLEAVDDE